ncbi:ATP-dependent zinc protease [Candidatus Microgenomates bacterium]|nr:ATP-dependent zinc protease [Candidatus Microgenomates bacterium]
MAVLGAALMKSQKVLIGRIEKVSFPEFKLRDVPAKVDTGSYRGTLHCHKIEEIVQNGDRRLQFVPLDPWHKHFGNHRVEVNEYKIAFVRSSSGHREMRFIVTTPIIIRRKKFDIELSLSRRHTMRYPVLLGRKFLKGRFVIDVGRRTR